MAAQDDNQGSGRIANVDENVKHITRGGKKVTEEDMKLAKLLQNVAKERGLTETQKYALGSKLKYASELRDAGKKKFFVGKLVFTFQVILQLSVPLILSFAEVIGGNGTKDTLIIITIAIGLVVMVLTTVENTFQFRAVGTAQLRAYDQGIVFFQRYCAEDLENGPQKSFQEMIIEYEDIEKDLRAAKFTGGATRNS